MPKLHDMHMRIMYVVTASEYGGPSRHISLLMKRMVKEGHKVGLVAAPEDRLRGEIKSLDVSYFVNPYFVRKVRLHKDFLAFFYVLRAIRKFRPDLVSAHSTKAGFAARAACFFLGIKAVIFTAHGWAFTEGRALWKRRLLALVERCAARVTAQIICVSHHDLYLARMFHVCKKEKLVVIHNGCDPESFSKIKPKILRLEDHVERDLVITFVGRLSPPKDPFTFLNSCKMIEGNFKVLIVGGGELQTSIEQSLVENSLNAKVSLLGERTDIPDILMASDIFVLTSLWEGLPRTIIEAMIAGLPVVVSNVGGVSELVKDGVTGYVIPPQDPSILANVLQKLLGDEKLRQRMGEAGRKIALEKFTLERMIAQTKTVYEDVLAIHQLKRERNLGLQYLPFLGKNKRKKETLR